MSRPQPTPDQVFALLQSIAELAVGLQQQAGAGAAVVELGLYEDLYEIDSALTDLVGDVENALGEDEALAQLLEEE